MKRRRIVRVIPLLLVATCSVAWCCSFYGTTTVDYSTFHVNAASWSQKGKIYIWWAWSHAPMFSPGVSLTPVDSNRHPFPIYSFLGFSYVYAENRITFNLLFLVIPYWAIDSVAVLIGMAAWRKRGRNLNPATAFPVEKVKRICPVGTSR